MKQYVLEVPTAVVPLPGEPPAAAPPTVNADALSLREPGRWRWILLTLLIEPVALAILYLALTGSPDVSQAATSQGVAYIASFSFPREAEASAAQVAATPTSSIRQERGQYVVELHDEAPEQALAMLKEATKARVAGSDIFAGSPLRLTRSAAAATPRAAWQVVFGDVANFAVACSGNACEVRFVSLVKPDAQVAGPDSPRRAVSPIPAPTAPAQAPQVQAPVNPAASAQDSDGVMQD